MTDMIVAVATLALMNVTLKGVGPAVVGARRLPARVESLVDALPSALLGALLVVDLLGPRWRDVDWTLAPGLAVALVLRWCGRSHLLCIALALGVTALVRTVTA